MALTTPTAHQFVERTPVHLYVYIRQFFCAIVHFVREKKLPLIKKGRNL